MSDSISIDRIFLLNKSEVELYFPVVCDRLVYPTEYAKANGASVNTESVSCNGNSSGASYWWLRSPAYSHNEISDISSTGYSHLTSISTSSNVVRPAVWLWIGDEPECEERSQRCSGRTHEICTNGFWNTDEICGYCNQETLLCEECESGTYQCAGGKSQECVNGSWKGTECEFGCNPSSGKCDSTYSVGNFVTFGTYEQDNNLENGKEPISWKILEIIGNKALLLSERGLDTRRFDSYTNIWKDSEIRSWLNDTISGSFYYDTFSDEEKAKIVPSIITTTINYGTENYTSLDKIFLLSSSEVEQDLPVWCDRLVYPTEYAKANGARTSSSTSYCNGNSYYGSGTWWLRSSSYDSNSQYVHFEDSGSEYFRDTWVWDTGNVVRPAMWIWIGEEPECDAGESRCNETTREACINGFWNAYEICDSCNTETGTCR